MAQLQPYPMRSSIALVPLERQPRCSFCSAELVTNLHKRPNATIYHYPSCYSQIPMSSNSQYFDQRYSVHTTAGGNVFNISGGSHNTFTGFSQPANWNDCSQSQPQGQTNQGHNFSHSGTSFNGGVHRGAFLGDSIFPPNLIDDLDK